MSLCNIEKMDIAQIVSFTLGVAGLLAGCIKAYKMCTDSIRERVFDEVMDAVGNTQVRVFERKEGSEDIRRVSEITSLSGFLSHWKTHHIRPDIIVTKFQEEWVT